MTNRLVLNFCCLLGISQEGWEYQVSYGGGEEGEDDEDDQQVGSELLLCLLMPTQKRVGSIKYPMKEERRVKMMKMTSRLVLNSCSTVSPDANSEES